MKILTEMAIVAVIIVILTVSIWRKGVLHDLFCIDQELNFDITRYAFPLETSGKHGQNSPRTSIAVIMSFVTIPPSLSPIVQRIPHPHTKSPTQFPTGRKTS
jgi:hypothetical protein